MARTSPLFDVSHPDTDKRYEKTAVFDSFVNPAAGGGTAQDKVMNSLFRSAGMLSHEYRAAMYARDGLITNIVDYAADDITRTWGKVRKDPKDSDGGGVITKEMNRLKAPVTFNKALKWARLFGGGLIYAVILDGNPPDRPVNYDKIVDIEALRIFELPDIIMGSCVWDEDPNSPNFGNIKIYRVRNRVYNKTWETNIHYTRCVQINGIQAPVSCNSATPLYEQKYFGVSIVDGIYEYIRDFARAHKNVSDILEELVVGKMKLADLDEILGTPGGKKKLKDRLDGIAASKSAIHAVVYGTDEDYTKDTTNISGVADLLDRFQMNLCAVSKYPVTKLFGRSSAGMNATGENEKSTYYDNLQSGRLAITDSIQWLINLISKWKRISVYTPFVWNQLFQLDDKTKAELKQKSAEAFRTEANGWQIYASVGAVDADEVRMLKFTELPERSIEPDIPQPPVTPPAQGAAVTDPNGAPIKDPAASSQVVPPVKG